jgi:hypothetical protein
MSAQTGIALLLALAFVDVDERRLSAPARCRRKRCRALSLRRPLHSAEALLTDRSWLIGFALESAGFALYVTALALAPLTLVQSIAAGGIGILALASRAAQRSAPPSPGTRGRTRLDRRGLFRARSLACTGNRRGHRWFDGLRSSSGSRPLRQPLSLRSRSDAGSVRLPSPKECRRACFFSIATSP